LATLTWCSLLWSAPCLSLVGSVAAPALSPLLPSVLLSLPPGAIAATPAHPQLGAFAATRSLCCVMGLPPGAPVAVRCYVSLYCGAEGPLRPPPAPSLRVELPRADPVVGRRWVSSPWGSGAPHPRCWLHCGPLRYRAVSVYRGSTPLCATLPTLTAPHSSQVCSRTVLHRPPPEPEGWLLGAGS